MTVMFRRCWLIVPGFLCVPRSPPESSTHPTFPLFIATMLPLGSMRQLVFFSLRLLNKKDKDTLATAVDLCVAEGWSLVRSAHLFQPFLECLKKKPFSLCVDIFETKTPV